jgi:hypothetical protein
MWDKPIGFGVDRFLVRPAIIIQHFSHKCTVTFILFLEYSREKWGLFVVTTIFCYNRLINLTQEDF